MQTLDFPPLDFLSDNICEGYGLWKFRNKNILRSVLLLFCENLSPSFSPVVWDEHLPKIHSHQTANLWTLPCLYKALWNEGPWLRIPYIRLISWGLDENENVWRLFPPNGYCKLWCCKVRKTPNFVCRSTKNNSARLNSHAMCVFQ